jgi:transposase-like protein
VENVSVLVAIGVNQEGFREILGVAEGSKEDKPSWLSFLRHLKERGLQSISLAVSDKALGFVESLTEVYPQAKWQRCMVHFYRNVFVKTPRSKSKDVAAMLKAIHAQEDLEAARVKAAEVVKKLRTMNLQQAAQTVEQGIEETFTYYQFPREHWRRIRTNNPLERMMREIRRRTRVVGAFPDGQAALMLVAARLRHVAGTHWGSKRYLEMGLLQAKKLEEEVAMNT